MHIHRESGTRTRRAAVAVLSIVAILLPSSAFAEGESLETILAVWRKREATTKSVKVLISEQRLTGKGTHVGGGPPEDQLSKMKRVLIIDGVRMRHERTGELWAHAIGAPDYLTMYAVFDGAVGKKLDRTERNDDVFHSKGYIRKTERHTDVNNIYLSPVLRHFRALSPVFGTFNLDALKIISTDEVVNGDRCIVLQEQQAHKHWIRKYWVAPAKDMSVIRIIGLRPDGSTDHQVDATFKRDRDVGWVPSMWKGINFGDGTKVISSANDTVTEIQVNLLVPASTFDIVFPPGTQVSDHVLKKKYVVKPDGSHRQIMQREVDRGATYTQLMQSDTGFAGQSAPSGGARYRRIFMVAAVVVIAGALLVAFMGRSWWSKS